MSLDKSLKSKSTLARHRNVLNRAERIEVLEEDGKFSKEDSPFNLPKVGHRKVVVGGKEKKKATEGDEDTNKKN